MSQEFSPKDQVLISLHLWWVLVITMVLGGLIGFAIHHFRPPIYQAKATISTYIDFQEITDVLLTEYDEDMTINSVQSVLLSNDVIGAVLTQASSDGIILDYSSFMHQMSIYRKFTDYELFYRDRNPEVAKKIVDCWTGIGLQEIKKMQAEGNLPAYLTVNLGSLSDLPQNPTYSQTNSYVLSGSLIGLLIGIILTSTSFATTWVQYYSQ